MDRNVILIFLISLIVSSIAVFLDPVRWWDEAIYGSLGWNLHNSPFDYSFKKFDDLNKDYPGQAGFRAPLLPYVISVAYAVNESFPIEVLVPIFSALGSVALYLLCIQVFDKKTSALSALLLTLMPLHAYYSGKILTDVFSTTIATVAILFFWIGFEKGDNKFKALAGIFLGLTILARYTWIWLPAVLFLYLLIKNRSLKFIDKYFIFSIVLFLLVLTPWFWYGQQAYGTPLGPLIHASKATTYWGGLQPWYEYFTYMPIVMSLGILATALVGIFFAIKNIKEPFLLLTVIWLLFSIGFAISMPHKEDRFLMPATPVIALLAAFGISKMKRYAKHIAIAVLIIAIATSGVKFYDTMKVSYRHDSQCYIGAMNFLKTVENNSIVMNVNNPVIYFYTHKESTYAPQSQNELEAKAKTFERPIYYLSSKYDGSRSFDFKKEPVWRCGEDAAVWKLN